MIALGMAYTLASGTLIAIACWLLERIAQSAGIATRGIWAGGMALMIAVAASAGVRESPFRGAPPPPATAAAADLTTLGDGGGEMPGVAPVSSLPQRLTRARRSLETRITAVAGTLGRWNAHLAILWAVAAAFLGGVVGHAALEGLRLRHRLPRRDVGGTAVLVTDDVGPSAVGIGEPAILVPRWALDLDDALVKLLLRHESEHLAARDPLLLLAALLGVILVPWHLPLWWSWTRLRLAVEVDCDSRVLRAYPDVRRYGQLLLLAAQRSATPAWPNHAVVTVVAPLRPHASHLERRISAMTQPRDSRISLRAIPLALGVAVTTALLAALPTPWRAQAEAQGSNTQERVIAHLTEVGWHGDDGSQPSLLVYTTGGARVGIGTDLPAAISDTIRLDHVPAITADVTDGEVHIEVSGPGRVRLGGRVTGGPAVQLSATGRHLVILEGGVGVRDGDASGSR